MTKNSELAAEFARLNDALDRASDIASRILGDLAPGNDSDIPISRESVLDELGRLMRITTELRNLTGDINQEANSKAEPANLPRAQRLWESVRQRYKEALDVWENLGEAITGSMTTHLLAQHARDEGQIINEWMTTFPQEIDAQSAMSIVEEYGTFPRNEQETSLALTADPTSEQLQQEVSDKYLLQLKYSLGMTQAQIGRLMGVGQAAAATRLGRACDRLEPLIARARLLKKAAESGLDLRIGSESITNDFAIQWSHPPLSTDWNDGTQVEIVKTTVLVNMISMGLDRVYNNQASTAELRKHRAQFLSQIFQAGYTTGAGPVGATVIKESDQRNVTVISKERHLYFWAVGMYFPNLPNLFLQDNFSFSALLRQTVPQTESPDLSYPPEFRGFTDFRKMGEDVVEKVKTGQIPALLSHR